MNPRRSLCGIEFAESRTWDNIRWWFSWKCLLFQVGKQARWIINLWEISTFLFLSLQNCTSIDNTHRKTPMSCVQAEYLCKDGITCVHRSWICDGEQDCPGGDDEMMPNCQNITCRADQFQCADKSCIAGHFHCSGKSECRDGSDELNCRKHQKLFHCSRLMKSNFIFFLFFLFFSCAKANMWPQNGIWLWRWDVHSIVESMW